MKAQANKFLLLILAGFFAVCNQVSAQSNTATIVAKELEAFLEPVISERMNALHIPGAVFVFVKNGEILFAKGYGFADIAERNAVIPNETLFQIGSITKLFTATSVMQLVEQDKLELHRDVNDYLTRFQIEGNFREPITLHHLLTHTGGFDERFTGTMSRSPEEQMSIGDYLAERMPPRVVSPGVAANYSNHGMTLAGHIVEQASGVSYEQYVTENILKPLEMHQSSASPAQADDSLARDLATAYDFRSGQFHPLSRTFYGQIAPAGSIIASGTDMARFMIAHLQKGRFRDRRILNEQSVELMHRQQFTHHPRFPGWTYGFQESFRFGKRFLVHGGGARGYVALLVLLPEENAGFFIACNAAEAGLQEAVFDKISEHFYPEDKTSLGATESENLHSENLEQLAKLTGNYRYVRYSRRTLEKILALSQQIEVRWQEEGGLSIWGLEAKPVKLTQIEPFLFRRDDGEGLISFRLDENGQATHLFLGKAFTPAYEKISWYESVPAQITFIVFFFVIFLSASLIWLIAPIFKFLGKRKNTQTDFKRAKMIAGISSLLNLVFLIGFPLSFFSNRAGGIPEFFFGLPVLSFALLFLPIISTALTVLVFYFALIFWQKQESSFIKKVYYSLAALANFGFIPFLLYWNLLGFWY